MQDACTNGAELVLILTINSNSCAIQFDKNWFCHYPVGHDNGQDFMGEEFQEIHICYDVKSQSTTVNNPTVQALVECLHLTLGDQLHGSIYSIDSRHDEVYHLIQSCT